MQFGDKFLASVVVACAVGVGIGALLVSSFGRVEPSSRAFDQPLAEEQVTPPPAPKAPDLGAHAVEKVIASDVVALDGLVDKPADPELGKAILEQLLTGKQVLVTCDPATAETGFKDENGAYLVYLL